MSNLNESRIKEAEKIIRAVQTAAGRTIEFNSRVSILIHTMRPGLGFEEAVDICKHIDAHGFVMLADAGAVVTEFELVILQNALLHFANHCDAVREAEGPSAEEAAKTARKIFAGFVLKEIRLTREG